MNKLILVRGAPGSGKTTLAKKLATELGNSEIVAADDFFQVGEEYKFNFNLLKVAHEYCKGLTFYHLMRGENVVVHNVFAEKWTIAPFVETAFTMGLKWEIQEPKTKWKSDAAELAQKNVHGLTQVSIQKMLDKWETTKDLMDYFAKQGWIL